MLGSNRDLVNSQVPFAFQFFGLLGRLFFSSDLWNDFAHD